MPREDVDPAFSVMLREALAKVRIDKPTALWRKGLKAEKQGLIHVPVTSRTEIAACLNGKRATRGIIDFLVSMKIDLVDKDGKKLITDEEVESAYGDIFTRKQAPRGSKALRKNPTTFKDTLKTIDELHDEMKRHQRKISEHSRKLFGFLGEGDYIISWTQSKHPLFFNPNDEVRKLRMKAIAQGALFLYIVPSNDHFKRLESLGISADRPSEMAHVDGFNQFTEEMGRYIMRLRPSTEEEAKAYIERHCMLVIESSPPLIAAGWAIALVGGVSFLGARRVLYRSPLADNLGYHIWPDCPSIQDDAKKVAETTFNREFDRVSSQVPRNTNALSFLTNLKARWKNESDDSRNPPWVQSIDSN